MKTISNTKYVLQSFLINIVGPLSFFVLNALSDWLNNILGQQIGIFNSPIARFLPLVVLAGIIIYSMFQTYRLIIQERPWKRETYQHLDKNAQSFVSQGAILSLMLSFNVLCSEGNGGLLATEKFGWALASLMPTVVGIYQANQIYNWVDRIYHDAHHSLEKIRLSGRTRFTEASIINDLIRHSDLFRKLHQHTQVEFVRQKMKVWADELIDKGENMVARKNTDGEMTISFFHKS